MTIYRDHALTYRRAGWKGVLPIPPGSKDPPPPGFTGHLGKWPTASDIAGWRYGHHDSNIALRLPRNVIGIDVDAYDGKRGWETLSRLEDELGPLPLTWVITSRGDGVSGIRLYRVMVETEGEWHSPGPGIDIIHHGHRYVVAPPSNHPDGGTYKWINELEVAHLGVPSPDDLPELT